ncbi:MAG TPA: head GIN domain-containing protein [Chitinophagales bacterium]|nr:head GIN domain-containing protein [Chitinophagales bacterium]
MNILKSGFLISSCIILLLAIASCSHCINGSGNTVTVIREVGNFSSVSFGTEGTIYVSQSPVTSVKIVAQQDVIDDMSTNVNGGELNIYNRHCLTGSLPITIYVTTPDLNGVKMSGNGDLYVTSKVNAGNFDATLSGSGNIYIQDSVVAAAMSTTISGSGSIDLIAFCNTMNTTISGSGTITISGISPSHTAKTSGSGNLHAYGFITDASTITISGSGNEELFVNDALDVTISGSGNVYYKGDAVVTTHISGSGNVIHVN